MRTLLQFRRCSFNRKSKTLAFAMPAPFHLPDDIVPDILIRLPARSIGRFRCVCKRWLSLASDPEFILTHASHAPITGFFFRTSSHNLFLNPQPYSLALPSNFYVESSCNGLILIADGRSNYAVYNPTTAKSWPIFTPNGYWWTLTLAFDPSRSPHFKIIRQGVENYIYSSETRTWRRLRSQAFSVYKGVFWNGHVVWDTQDSSLSCFDVEAEQFSRVSLPWNKTASLYPHYIGESRGSLHLVGAIDSFAEINRHLDIWDLKNDLSGWSLLCSIDIAEIIGIPKEIYYGTSILYFHRGGGGGDQLLLNICGKITVYHLQDKTCLSLCDGMVTGCHWWYNIFLHSETLISL